MAKPTGGSIFGGGNPAGILDSASL